MYLIDKILVDEHIGTKPFLCDLNKCKGACCTIFGTSGAPLLDSEVKVIRELLDKIKPYLSERSLKYIEKHDFFQGKPGNYSTSCIKMRDCVFVYYKDNDDIAYCAIEQAYKDGIIEYKKPISCHLFPIRVGEFGGTSLYYEKMSVCKPALKTGKEKDVKIYQMTEEALVRAFGQEWYDKYAEFLNNINLEK